MWTVWACQFGVLLLSYSRPSSLNQFGHFYSFFLVKYKASISVGPLVLPSVFCFTLSLLHIENSLKNKLDILIQISHFRSRTHRLTRHFDMKLNVICGPV